MSQVSRPMQIALAATLLLLAVWFVALRPKPTSGGGSAAAPAPSAQSAPTAPGAKGLTRAVDKAHGAVATANGDAARAEQSDAEAPARSGASGAPASAGGASTRAATGGATPHPAGASPVLRRPATSGPVRALQAAVRQRKAVAIAFVDPHTADARAVAQEVRHVSTFGGRAVVLAVPLSKLSAYAFITREVEVTVAPTVVIVDPRHRASTIVGFSDRREIEQRLADALAVKPKR
jgi:hypothetical protein